MQVNWMNKEVIGPKIGQNKTSGCIKAKLVSSRAHNDGWLEEEHVTTLKPGGIYGHYKILGAVLSTPKDMK